MDAIKGIVSVQTGLSSFENALFQNGKVSRYLSGNYTVSPRITSQLLPLCNVTYEFSISQNWMKIKNANQLGSYKNYSQTLSVHINPLDKWLFSIKGEHYSHEITSRISKQLFLADTEFTYSLKGGWELNFQAKNIFNQNFYAYTIYDGLTEMKREFKIRPINILAGLFLRF